MMISKATQGELQTGLEEEEKKKKRRHREKNKENTIKINKSPSYGTIG
jgi:hypothetical protein